MNPRQARFLLRRPKSRKNAVGNIASECNLFLSSGRLEHLLANLPERPAPWEDVLKKALTLWSRVVKGMEDCGDDGNEDVEENNINTSYAKELWEIVCVLVKANFYLQNGLPLDRIQTESFDAYAMHAAVGLVTNVKTALVCPVIERLLQLHAGQLQIKEPVHGRLPLHVIAATLYKADRVEILLGILQADPHAATVMDNRGIYPLHLACQAKYPWKSALAQVYKAAPHVGELTCPCCPPELLAQQDCYDRSLDTVYALAQTDEATLLD